ncbi:tetratricopeptide repeat protein [Algoriphagus zhangzhouensis]|uniref:Tetratricopeptide repeat-containing protein n=2 Tax=Algoriphagus zhangzhouensis TaxID=1073327 RepID=A0A1M7Z3T7_9BACT|nr:tetratricopeptide repeat protein [Algoriphagus zhangzhouensis]SHO59618.1 Tetratricopeptide repeat-containing protein [Algoriphagus zhangzhouensis]
MKLKVFVILSLIFGNVFLASSQTSLPEIDIENGPNPVGFKHYATFDSSRTYSKFYDFSTRKTARPIPISIWYPAESIDGSEALDILDYMRILTQEEEWEHLPDDQILNWFYYSNTPENQKHLEEITSAFPNAPFRKGKFPLIIYASSFQASSIENFALFEYLASHGFVVISSPSRGTKTRWFTGNFPMEIETQVRDVEFLMNEANKIANADLDKIALMGFSFGGLANIIVQNRNDRVKAVVSLDGTERYQYQLLEKSPFFNPDKVDVPYIHFAQKDFPDQVLKEDEIDPELNSIFQLYDSLTRSEAYQLKMNNLSHSYFSTLGVLFENRDLRQDKSDLEIMESYQLVSKYVLNFLRSTLEKDTTATEFLSANPVENGILENLISFKTKKAEERAFTFQDFNDLASEQKYDGLFTLYESVVKDHPDFEIPEGSLNQMALQLVFNPETSQKGINLFLFGTKLFPNSANLYDSLGEGYYYMGEKEKAIESFKKSLKLYPENQNAIQRLKELEN